ncbi:MAG: DinB family protein, partial [Bacteroidota bacterium]
MKITVLNREENNEYYDNYIHQIPEDLSLKDAYQQSISEVVEFFTAIPEEKGIYRYAEGKWSIKEVFQHLIDSERIFAYRMFRIGRGDKAALAGFDQNEYIEPSGADAKTMTALIEEFQVHIEVMNGIERKFGQSKVLINA